MKNNEFVNNFKAAEGRRSPKSLAAQGKNLGKTN
jgi:hypothetical protein